MWTSAACFLWLNRVASASTAVSTPLGASAASVRVAIASPPTAVLAQVRSKVRYKSRRGGQVLIRLFHSSSTVSILRRGRVREAQPQLHGGTDVRQHLRRFPLCGGQVPHAQECHLHQDLASVRGLESIEIYTHEEPRHQTLCSSQHASSTLAQAVFIDSF